ncbi:hypothetical protein EWM64_g6778 [Hericium alpestre]|uniref:Phospholipase/carboxylesterase/thioesterase domain-containing protein n=1 Tax=Hericium alpestre TaxID=135208 RepID=A0A4Y9ZT77_9AGAM|nr:hypothetical protein EWM64_g6778 [Hericium alpestre]
MRSAGADQDTSETHYLKCLRTEQKVLPILKQFRRAACHGMPVAWAQDHADAAKSSKVKGNSTTVQRYGSKMSTEFHVREAANEPSPRVKPTPKSSSIPVPFSYTPSNDGTDENLLILLHGLAGDTHAPFSKLGRSLKLPQTATLTLRAPEQIPYLYEEAYQWYESFDPLGEFLQRPNPTSALDLLAKVLDHLTNDCAWPAHRIHLFGFAQGGTVAAETALRWWRERSTALGSVVTVTGPLLSYPTSSNLCPMPILVFHRPPPAESALPRDAMTAFRKGFSTALEAQKAGEGMPRSKEEWEPIMKFWSERLGRRQVEDLYEVMSGASAA